MRYSEGLDSCQGSLIWHQREVTWEQGPIRVLALFTPQRDWSLPSTEHAQRTNFGLLVDTGWGYPIQVDRLVSYPLYFIYLRYNYNFRWTGRKELDHDHRNLFLPHCALPACYSEECEHDPSSGSHYRSCRSQTLDRYRLLWYLQ